jgi:hypothetical protein
MAHLKQLILLFDQFKQVIAALKQEELVKQAQVSTQE